MRLAVAVLIGGLASAGVASVDATVNKQDIKSQDIIFEPPGPLPFVHTWRWYGFSKTTPPYAAAFVRPTALPGPYTVGVWSGNTWQGFKTTVYGAVPVGMIGNGWTLYVSTTLGPAPNFPTVDQANTFFAGDWQTWLK